MDLNDHYYVKEDQDFDIYNLSEKRRDEWLRLVAEKQQARKVKGRSGLPSPVHFTSAPVEAPIVTLFR